MLFTLGHAFVRASTSSLSRRTLLVQIHSQGIRCFASVAPEKSSPISTSSSGVKPNINIGTIGHIDHGKTTLTAAITKFLSKKGKTKFVKFDEIDKAKEEKKRGITINIAHIGYETNNRRYAHTDCPGHRDFIKNMICGTAQMDAAILVIAATDGVMVQTKEHLLLAKQIGVKNVIVFINKADAVSAEDLELVEIEARELLSDNGFDDLKIPIVKGSALRALESDEDSCMEELINKIDAIPLPERLEDGPFLLPISSVVKITGRGTVIVGTVESGVLRKGETIEVKGFDDLYKTIASDIQVFNKSVPQVSAGEHCGVLCRRLHGDNVRRGMWAGTPGTIRTTNLVKVQLYLLDESEGGRSTGIRTGFTDHIFSSTWDQAGRLHFVDAELLMPGEHTDAHLIFIHEVPLRKNMTFTIREGRARTLARGVVTELYRPTHVGTFRKLDTDELLKKAVVMSD